jgi:plasmid stability protein
MKNVTVTLDDEIARWARIEAARREMSVSRFIREMLRERMGGQAAYDGAMGRYLSRSAVELKDVGPYPGREELHDRAGLR